MEKFRKLYLEIDEIENMFHMSYFNEMPFMEKISDVQEFIIWKQQVLFELMEINKGNNNQYIMETIDFLNNEIDEYNERQFFNELKGRLIVIKDMSFSVKDDEAQDSLKPKLFISHNTKDQDIVGSLVELLEDIGFDENTLFCSSYPGYDIPMDEDVYEYIEMQFKDFKVRTLFILSENYYQSVASLNEMGATWILKNNYSSILLPGFEFRNIRGVINPNKIALKLDNPLDELKNKLNQLKNILIKEFQLPQVGEAKWERKRDEFIGKIENNNLEQNENKMSQHENDILMLMAEDDSGELIISEFISGTQIGNGNRVLYSNESGRELAKWKQAIKELEDLKYIEAKNTEKSIYILTESGYLYLDCKSNK